MIRTAPLALAILVLGCDPDPSPSTPGAWDRAPPGSDGPPPDGERASLDQGALDDLRFADAAVTDGAADGAAADGAAADGAAAEDAQRPPLTLVTLDPQPLDQPFSLQLDAPATAILVQARGPDDALLAVVDVFGPPGRLIGPAGQGGPSRSAFNPGVALALLPNDGETPLPAGEYSLRIIAAGADAAGPLPVEVWIRRPGPVHLRVNAWLPPALGLTLEDPALALFAAALRGRLAAFGPDTVEVHLGLLGPDAPSEARINGLARDLSGLAALAAHRPADTPPGLELYLVDDIFDGLNRINGLAGGLPAPVDLVDAPAAVIAVRAALLADFPAAVADFAQHELGHALGLFHTTEATGAPHDPIEDTLPCPLGCDADGDGLLLARECGAQGAGAPPCQGAADNVMFWTLGGRRDTTPGQRRVTRSHPLTALGPP